MNRNALQSAGCWMIKQFEKFADRIALIHQEQSYTYGQLSSGIQSAHNLLQENTVKPGQTVALLADCSFEILSLFFALLQNKNIIVPLISDNASEIKEKLNIVKPDCVIQPQQGTLHFQNTNNREQQSELVQKLTVSNKAGLILFSSGSTGTPKAMLHDLDRMVNTYQNKPPKTINILLFLLFDHIGGIDTLLRALSIGATITLPVNRDPIYIASLIETHQVNVLPASPTFLNLLLLSGAASNFNLTSLKVVGYGAEPMPEPLLKRLNEALPNTAFQQKFGTSETNAIRIVSRSADSLYIKIDDPNAEYKVVRGELWLKSQSQILGYLNASTDRFSEDNWFKTGDLVELAPDGYFKIIGRVNDVINVGGEKVFPAEVECLLMELPEIKACLVFGEPNVITGNTVVAEVQTDITLALTDLKKKIKSYCWERLEPYKVPSKIRFVDAVAYTDRYKKIRNRSS